MLGRSVDLETPSREAIFSRQQHQTRENLERLEQSLKLWRIVELDVLSRIQLVVDGRREQPPALGLPFIKPRKPSEEEFVKHLTNIKKVFRARIEFRRNRELVDIRARYKAERGRRVLADVPPVYSQAPKVIRILRAETV